MLTLFDVFKLIFTGKCNAELRTELDFCALVS